MSVRFIHRIRVEGTCPAADWLRLYLHRCGYTLVVDNSYGFMLTVEEGSDLSLDSVDSDLERKILEHLQEQEEKRHWGCGAIRLIRAGGNQDPMQAVVTVPALNLVVQEGVATAVLHAILQASEQVDPPVKAGVLADSVPVRRFWWWPW